MLSKNKLLYLYKIIGFLILTITLCLYSNVLLKKSEAASASISVSGNQGDVTVSYSASFGAPCGVSGGLYFDNHRFKSLDTDQASISGTTNYSLYCATGGPHIFKISATGYDSYPVDELGNHCCEGPLAIENSTIVNFAASDLNISSMQSNPGDDVSINYNFRIERYNV